MEKWLFLIAIPSSIAIVFAFIPTFTGSKINTAFRAFCCLWVFLLAILGMFTIMFRMGGFYMQPKDPNKPQYEQIQEPVYKQVK